MILNDSRASQFRQCQRKAYYWNELRLRAQREAEPLLVGGAFHKGIELINRNAALAEPLPAEQVLELAVAAAEKEFRERVEWPKLLKEEVPFYEDILHLSKMSVKAYGEHYIGEKYQLLKPEVPFLVPLPNTVHHCHYFHNLLQKLGELSEANEQAITRPDGRTDCTDERCMQPHYLAGTSDAIIVWNRVIWLMEHKTTAYDLYNQSGQSKNYIRQWQLNTQATHYIYGIWRATKVRPHGVLLNVVIKPRKNASVPTFNFYREGFLRTEQDLLRHEREMTILADNYEQTMRLDRHIMNPQACYDYNRECYFHNSCTRHRVEPAEFTLRAPDYVEDNYYKVLGLEPPTKENTNAATV